MAFAVRHEDEIKQHITDPKNARVLQRIMEISKKPEHNERTRIVVRKFLLKAALGPRAFRGSEGAKLKAVSEFREINPHEAKEAIAALQDAANRMAWALLAINYENAYPGEYQEKYDLHHSMKKEADSLFQKAMMLERARKQK